MVPADAMDTPYELHDIAQALADLRSNPDPWMHDAVCNFRSEDWFAERRGVDAAKAVCATCPVTEECLEYALTHRIAHGVWGGKSGRERDVILRDRDGHP